jgi:hypothetical protein
MKMHGFAMAALPLLAVLGVSGMQSSSPQDAPAPKGRLTRVRDADNDKQERFDREAWKKRLGAADFDERVRAFDELAGLAGRNGDARKALEAWSKDNQDSELAWTSRLLLREVDRSPRHAFGPRGMAGRGGMGGNFDFDDFSRRFDDLDSMFGDLRSQWGDMLGTLPAPAAGSKSSSQSMSLQVGPDGVTCEVTENVDGKEQKHTYTAGSIDELLEAHPELRDHLGGTGFQVFGRPHGSVHIFPRGLSGSSPRPSTGGEDLFDQDTDAPDANGEPPTDRLGIQCRPVGKDRATELGLSDGVGLSVEDVLPGTIAGLLGLRRGDVVIEVDGATIHGTEDVKKALQDRAANADVSVVVVGGDGHKRTLNWKPKPAEVKGQKAEAKSGSRKL